MLHSGALLTADLLATNRLRDHHGASAESELHCTGMRCAQWNVSRSVVEDRGRWTRRPTWRFQGNALLVPVVRPGASDTNAVLTGVRTCLLDLVAGIEEGTFPPRPYDLHICSYCAYPSVCRKDWLPAMSSARLPFDESPDTIEVGIVARDHHACTGCRSAL